MPTYVGKQRNTRIILNSAHSDTQRCCTSKLIYYSQKRIDALLQSECHTPSKLTVAEWSAETPDTCDNKICTSLIKLEDSERSKFDTLRR